MPKYLTQRPYPDPEPRLFSEWCNDLGLKCVGDCPTDGERLTFDTFTLYPNVQFYKIADSELYNFWRRPGEEWPEGRTAQEWLNDYDLELVEPTEMELSELNLYLPTWDDFMNWSAGIVYDKKNNKPSLFQRLLHICRNRIR